MCVRGYAFEQISVPVVVAARRCFHIPIGIGCWIILAQFSAPTVCLLQLVRNKVGSILAESSASCYSLMHAVFMQRLSSFLAVVVTVRARRFRSWDGTDRSEFVARAL